MKPVIGLAGGIGAGKSAVADALAHLGCLVTSSDADGRAALEDPQIKETLHTWWGDAIFDDDGDIDRSAVAHIVFADTEQRRRLEALTHPWIEARRRTRFDDAPADVVAFVIDAPLLFEVGLERECDAVIFVDAPRDLRLARVATTRGWSEAELRRREESQLPLDVKRVRADYVLENDSGLSELQAHVRTTLEQILETFARSRRY